MSNFDLRKFIAEQRTAKVKNVKEETIKEFDAGVVAVGAPIVMSVVASGIAKLGFDKIMQAIARIDKDKFKKFVDKYASTFEEGHDMEEAHDEMEEAVNEAHDEMEEGEMNEDIGKVIDFIMQNADKSVDWIKKNINMEEAHDEMEEAHDEMEEGEIDESVVAGVAALIGSTLAATKVLDFIQKKYPEAVKKFVKAVEAGEKASYRRMEEGDDKEMEESLNESDEKFKASIKEILNS